MEKKKRFGFRQFIRFIAWIVLIICLYIIGTEVYLSIRTKNDVNGLQDIRDNNLTTDTQSEVEIEDDIEQLKMLPHLLPMYEENNETVGWLTVYNTQADMPIVHKTDKEIGNSYYLKHNFYNENSKAGWLFVDNRNVITDTERSDNILIHGHNQKDLTMFGGLKKYKEIDFYKENPLIKFSSLYEEADYKIIGYFVADTNVDSGDDLFDYYNYIDFENQEHFDKFISEINERSYMHNDVDANINDDFITLSTCTSEFPTGRFVIIARKIREGESSEVDISKVVKNEHPKRDPYWKELYW